MALLDDVARLASSIGNVTGDVASTCETAGHFFLYHIFPRWEQYLNGLQGADASTVATKFPFTSFFADAPQPLFSGTTVEENVAIAKGCMAHIEGIFRKLEEYRPFELLHKVSLLFI